LAERQVSCSTGAGSYRGGVVAELVVGVGLGVGVGVAMAWAHPNLLLQSQRGIIMLRNDGGNS